MKKRIKKNDVEDTAVDDSRLEERQGQTEETKKKNTKNSFNFIEVLLIMIVTAICAITITIKVSYVVNKTPEKIMMASDLVEFNETYNALLEEYYDTVDKKELVAAAIEGMVDYLGDPYSVYMDEEETETFNEELEGEYVGMGAEISYREDNQIHVVTVFEDSPALRSGMKVGDVIIKVDGQDVNGKTLEEISYLIKGEKSTEVKVTILRDDTEIELNIIRGTIDIQSVRSRIITSGDQKIGVLDVSLFAHNTYEQFVEEEKALEEQGVDSLIIDLRGNSGGYLDVVTKVASLFLKKGDVIYQLDTKGSVQKITNSQEPIIKLKTFVLIDKGSASASEILTAALKENIDSEIIGVTTYGKGKVQKTRTLSNGAMIKYTIQNWLTPSGKEIDGVGISPTIEVKLDDEYLKNPSDTTDNQLQKALEEISK